MLDGISDIARGMRSLGSQEPDLTFGSMIEELRAKYSPKRLSELLSLAGEEDALKRQCAHRARCLLRKASIAAKTGKQQRCSQLKQLALEALNGDQSEFDVIVEENRFSFSTPTPQHQAPVPRVRAGFVR